MTWLYVALVLAGALGGTAGTVAIQRVADNRSAQAAEGAAAAAQAAAAAAEGAAKAVEAAVAEDLARADIQKSLTTTDLLVTPCGSEYIAAHGEGLCREMFCRITTVAGAEAKTAGMECEQIGNANTTASMLSVCATLAAGGAVPDLDTCLDAFGRRK